MATYTLIGSASTVQVLSPTLSQDAVLATIQTVKTGVIATMAVSQVAFNNNGAAEELTALADSIDTIIGQGKAVGGTGTSSLDSNGLQQYFVTFTVAYNPPGAPSGQVTVDADVPVTLMSQSDAAIGETLLNEAEAIVNNSYQNLVNMSQG